jgi:large exoprotein involved in heme utilization and adhesion
MEINARNVEILNNSTIVAGIAQESGEPGAQAGDINIDAAENVELFNSDVFSEVNTGAIGNGGDINIQAKSLSLAKEARIESYVVGSLFVSESGRGNAGKIQVNVSDRITIDGDSQISTFTQGFGSAGDITIDARDGDLPVISMDGKFSGILAFTVPETLDISSNFDGGNIAIAAESFSLTNGAQISSRNAGALDAGNIDINVSKDANFEGIGEEFFSGVVASYQMNVNGRGSNVSIKAGNLSIAQGAVVQTFSDVNSDNVSPKLGNAGNIDINVKGTLSLDGVSQVYDLSRFSGLLTTKEQSPSAISISLAPAVIGRTGKITIRAENLSIANGALIENVNAGGGNAGNIEVNVSDAIALEDESKINAGTIESSGDIKMSASELSLTNGSQIANVNTGEGNAGNIEVNVSDAIALAGGSQINAQTFGATNAGNIKLAGRNGLLPIVRIDGAKLIDDAPQPSGIFNTVEPLTSKATGYRQAGEISITAESLFVTDGAGINASTIGDGNANKIDIKVEDVFKIDGVSQAFSFDGLKTNFRSEVVTALNSNSEGNAGEITIDARKLSITNGAQIVSTTLGKGDAGNININVSDRVNLDGASFGKIAGSPTIFSSRIFSNVEQNAIGNGGDINIEAGALSLANNALLFSRVAGTGNGGNIFVKVDSAIALTNSYINSGIEAGGEGIGGDIEVNARSLSLTEGSQISAAVSRADNNLPAGIGKAGSIEVNANNFVSIAGVSPNSFSGNVASRLFASAERGTAATESQAAGDINVTTKDFRLTDTGEVNASTANAGAGGNIAIDANTLTVSDGGQILTLTQDGGNAGDIDLNVSDRITLDGGMPETSGIFADTTSNSTGNGGNIFIDPSTMIISDRAVVTVNSQGKGTGGNIEILAGNLALDNEASILAATASTQGGNITLISDLLTMRRDSNISATAGIAQAGGDGGQIDIATDFLLAFPGDSNIAANAFQGSGGNVEITAEGIFGIAFRDRSSLLTNDITASSQFGTPGTVALNTPDTDPERGLVELPEAVSDPSDAIAQNPCRRGTGSHLIVTGRGGVPSNPNETLSSDSIQVDLVEPVATQTTEETKENANGESFETTSKAIAPAQGWVFNSSGEVVLTAEKPNSDGSQRTPTNSTTCPAP